MVGVGEGLRGLRAGLGGWVRILEEGGGREGLGESLGGLGEGLGGCGKVLGVVEGS